MRAEQRAEVISNHIATYEEVMKSKLEAEEIVYPDASTIVAKDLGIIVVTSVLHLHPSTDLLKAVLATHLKNEPLLQLCEEKWIVADHCKLAKPDKTKFKSGQVQADHAERYEQYLVRLEELCASGDWPFDGFRVHRMPIYGGFGMSLKTGLELLRAPYALILQHDRVLKQAFGIEDVLVTMKRRPNLIRYIGLASNSSWY
jgi:hypothetical protein